MITRSIGIELDINEHAANEIYMNEHDFAKTNNGDLNSILEHIYSINGISPLSMTWELTADCNFKCPFCYIHNIADEQKKSFQYSFNDIRKELDVLIDRGLLICYLTGGECLMHPDFIDIYTYLKKKGVLVAVLTNAALLSKKHLDVFTEYPPYKVEVSIYGTESTYSKQNPSGCASKVLSNVLTLKKMGINVIAKMPYNKCTEIEFDHVRDWCETNAVDFYFSDELFDSYDGRDNTEYRELISRTDTTGGSTVQVSGKREYKKVFDCSAGKHSFVLAYNGKMRPCFAFYEMKAPEWCFDIRMDGLVGAYDKMRSKIASVAGNKLMYCNGCVNCISCQECIATLSCAENPQRHMAEHCVCYKM